MAAAPQNSATSPDNSEIVVPHADITAKEQSHAQYADSTAKRQQQDLYADTTAKDQGTTPSCTTPSLEWNHSGLTESMLVEKWKEVTNKTGVCQQAKVSLRDQATDPMDDLLWYPSQGNDEVVGPEEASRRALMFVNRLKELCGTHIRERYERATLEENGDGSISE